MVGPRRSVILALLCTLFRVDVAVSDETHSVAAGELTSEAPSTTAPPLPTSIPRALPLALTISGGVSLGAYEGGYLYYLTELLKENPGRLDVPIVTGASAGGINGLLTIMSTCTSPIPEPGDSLFWKTWVPVSAPPGW